MIHNAVCGIDAGRPPREGIDPPPRLRLIAFDFSSLSQELGAPSLDQFDIHVWHGDPQRCAIPPQQLIPLLSEDELDRMARFHFEPDRQDFCFARGMLRILLGRYLDTAPQDLRFSYSEHGKPSLVVPDLEAGLQFNLSHTNGRVLVAICRGYQIGIDIEKLRKDINIDEVAARFFSASEREALMNLPHALRWQAFFHCWTRKEALLKARGDGLFFPLGLFDVSIAAGEREVTLVTRPDAAEAQRWRILRVSVPAEYTAAVAVACPASR